MRHLLVGLAMVCLAAAPLAGQDPPPAGPLRVFLDCQGGCDDSFIRTELTWVDYVRDRTAADVHVLITSQVTGGGGREYNLRFIGLRALTGQDQERQFSIPITAASDQARIRMVRALALGLVRYVGDRPEADQLQVNFARPAAGQVASAPARDPWNRWLFTISGNGNYFGESRSNSSNLSGSFRARRIVQDWKLDMSMSVSRSKSTFILENGTEIVSRINGYSGNFLLGRSLGSQLSAGVRMGARNSTRNNEDLVVRPVAVVEYSLFPYSESTRRLVTLEYGIGAYSADYIEETVYGVTSELLARQYLAASVSYQQPWGSLGMGASFQNYLRDFSQNRVGVFGSTNVRVAKGLQLNLLVDYGRPRDQLSIQRGTATDEDVLLRLRQLQTNFTIFSIVGVSYSFGSVFNAVVNPRFRNGDPASGGSGGCC